MNLSTKVHSQYHLSHLFYESQRMAEYANNFNHSASKKLLKLISQMTRKSLNYVVSVQTFELQRAVHGYMCSLQPNDHTVHTTGKNSNMKLYSINSTSQCIAQCSTLLRYNRKCQKACTVGYKLQRWVNTSNSQGSVRNGFTSIVQSSESILESE